MVSTFKLLNDQFPFLTKKKKLEKKKAVHETKPENKPERLKRKK